MTKWEVSKTIIINRSPSSVWQVLKKVQEWPLWDVDLKEVILPEPIDPTASLEGKKGMLHMNWGSKFNFTIQNVRELEYVEYETPLPFGSSAIWFWKLKEQNGGESTELNMGCSSSSWFWGLILKPLLPKAFVECTGNLKSLVETGSVPPKPSK